MITRPTKQQLIKALIAASRAHHEFQTNYMDGVRHEQWAWWYSAYILGRLTEFTTPTLLTKWLEEVTDVKSWFTKAAEYILLRIKDGNESD